MAKLKLKNMWEKTNKTIKKIYEDYLDFCISIGQSDLTIKSNKDLGDMN